jgi:dephospho-CoA kinase
MKVILINGAGGSGKDTFVELLKTYFLNTNIVENISTIDDVKFLAHRMGWDGVKDERGRQFLADLKNAWTKYNNGANERVLEKIVKWNSDENISSKSYLVFIHCREPEALSWFVEKLKKRKIQVCSLYVERLGIEEFSNSADKNVNQFSYDIVIHNNGTLDDLENIAKSVSKLINNWKHFKQSIGGDF